jgi:aminopeptidase N
MTEKTRFDPVRLEDYRPPAFTVEHLILEIEIDSTLTSVLSTMAVSHNLSETFELNGQGLTLKWIRRDGVLLGNDDYVYQNDLLHIFNAPQQFELQICSTISPRDNPREMGLFERRGILATECEPYGFRRICFFPDRPDVLTTYTVTLTGDRDRYPVMLSNGNPQAQGELDDGRWWIRWHDPFPKPSYIFAFFAGRLGRLRDSYTTGGGRVIDLNIYVEEPLVGQCMHAMSSLKRALRWDEETYGFEYDLDVYNIVGLVGHGNAMENKGLNLFGAEGIVADKDTASDTDYLVIERILAHEVFHNWTGNRVTCRDWFQLCMKEGLTRYRDQSYDQSLAMGTIKRIWQVKALRRNQFADDDGPNAHAVRPRSYYTVENFYNSTVYDKGAEIVRMLHGLLGNESFHRGMELFVQRHDLQAVTLEDFLAAMADAGGRDLRQFARWYDIVGRPRLDVEREYRPDRHEYELRFTQRESSGIPQPVVIPVAMGLVSENGGALTFRLERADAETTADTVLEIDQRSQSVIFHDVSEAPIPSLLRGFSAPVSLEIALSRRELRILAAGDSDPYVRWDSMQRLYIGVIRELAEQYARGSQPGCDPELIGCVQTILSSADHDKGLAAELLDVADEPNLSMGMARIDLDGLMKGRKQVMDTMAESLHHELLETYQRNQSSQPWAFDEPSISRRMLKNACLTLLGGLGDQNIIDSCYRQLITADCLTDRFAALNCLIDLQCPERDEAIEWTWQQWRSSPLLMNNWFKAQAMGRTPDVIPRLQALLEHPAYDPGSTTQAMALLGTFFRQNRVAFHDPSGAAYSWLADVLLYVDKLRPGGTAWLMPQINQWRRYDDNRKQLMQQALQRVAGTEGISRALYENVHRALGLNGNDREYPTGSQGDQ